MIRVLTMVKIRNIMTLLHYISCFLCGYNILKVKYLL